MSATVLDARFVVDRRSFVVSAELSLAAGERLALFGPSGAGKTTCLEAIAGATRLAKGTVHIEGRLVNAAVRGWLRPSKPRPVDAKNRLIALVRQPTTLFPHLDVATNVGYGLRQKMAPDEVEALLASVGLGGLRAAMPESLSGGQRQRACLARALSRPFRTLLLDEPFSAVDVPARSGLRDLVTDTCNRAGAIAILVSHDLTEAQAFAHSIAVIDDGRLLQVGSVETIVRQPASVRVAELFGYGGFVPRGDGTMWAFHPDRFLEGALPDRGVVLNGVVRAVRPDGPRYSCELELRGEVVLPGSIEVRLDQPPPPGQFWEVTALDPPVVPSTPGL